MIYIFLLQYFQSDTLILLYISFLNFTASGKLTKVGGIFKSTRGTERGLGLGRIDSVVKRLGGYVSHNSEAGAFTTEVLLPLSVSEANS